MKIKSAGILMFVMAFILMSCSTSPEDAVSEADVLLTNVAQTVEAELALMVATTAVPPTETPTLAPTNTLIPTEERLEEPGRPGGQNEHTDIAQVDQAVVSSVSACDMAAFIADITVADGTQYAADTEFTKTWSLQNIGTCTWTSDYLVYFYSGSQMSGPSSQALTSSDVAPGETVEISIAMVAPSTTGQYVGYWALQNASGEHFGIGSSSDSFYVDITVTTNSATATTTLTPTSTSLYTSTPTATSAVTATLTSTTAAATATATTAAATATATSEPTSVPTVAPTAVPTATAVPEATSTSVPEPTATPTS